MKLHVYLIQYVRSLGYSTISRRFWFDNNNNNINSLFVSPLLYKSERRQRTSMLLLLPLISSSVRYYIIRRRHDHGYCNNIIFMRHFVFGILFVTIRRPFRFALATDAHLTPEGDFSYTYNIYYIVYMPRKPSKYIR